MRHATDSLDKRWRHDNRGGGALLEAISDLMLNPIRLSGFNQSMHVILYKTLLILGSYNESMFSFKHWVEKVFDRWLLAVSLFSTVYGFNYLGCVSSWLGPLERRFRLVMRNVTGSNLVYPTVCNNCTLNRCDLPLTTGCPSSVYLVLLCYICFIY